VPIEKLVLQHPPPSIGNRQSAIGNRKSAIPAILGQAMIAEIIRKKRGSLELMLHGMSPPSCIFCL
jgi:hypothetical protein